VSKRNGIYAITLFAALILPRAALGLPDPVGYWKFDETAGNTAHDYSGNGHDGSIEGASAWHPEEGVFEGALGFDGSTNGVFIPYRPAFDITDKLTIAAWIRQTPNNRGWILVRNTTDDSHRYYGLYAGGIYQDVTFHYNGESGKVNVKWTPVDIDDYSWHHLALVVDYPSAKLYVDGRPLEELLMAEPMVPGGNGDIKIGRRDPGNYYFEGMLDEVRIYGGALSPEDVYTLSCYGGGRGTEEEPYLIYSAGHMQTIGLNPGHWGKHFLLKNDIDMRMYSGEEGCPAFNTIAGQMNRGFSGVFDGGGHTISDFSFRTEAEFSVGRLFGVVSGEGAIIRNVKLKDVRVSGITGGTLVGRLAHGAVMTGCGVDGGTIEGTSVYIGGLVGDMYRSSISNSYARCDVSGSGYVGGLVGNVHDGEITRCYAAGRVRGGTGSIGGLVGENDGGSLSHCYASGDVSGSYNCVGGLVGSNSGDISHCCSGGAVTGLTDVGGLVGFNDSRIDNCYSTADVRGVINAGGLVGFNSPWAGAISSCYAAGRVEEHEKYDNHENLCGLVGKNSWNDQYGTVTGSFWDIEKSGQPGSNGGTGLSTEEMARMSTFASAGWDFATPVWTILESLAAPHLAWERYPGGSGKAGDPYLITGADQMKALWEHPGDWDKSFLMIADIDLTGHPGSEPKTIGTKSDPFTGLFDGNGRVISNLRHGAQGIAHAGLFGVVDGPAAEIRDVILHDPVVEVTSREAVGALVGTLAGKVIRCGAEGGSVSGGWTTGGLVGQNRGTISMCFARNDVTCAGDGYHAGGLAGSNLGRVSNCCALNRVSGGLHTGGLVGFLYTGAVTSSYAAGQLEGGGKVGGLIGCNILGRIYSSFWDIQTSSMPRMCGYGAGAFGCYDENGKTTAEMMRRDTFADWHLETLWAVDENNGYPRLRWEDHR